MRNEYDWRVFVEYRPGHMATYLYISRNRTNDTMEFLVNGGEEVKTIPRNGLPKDGDEVYFAKVEDDYVLRLLVEALDKRGIKPPEQSFIAGKLEATTAHLDDIRKLVPKLQDSSND